jgi:type I restriction enzyme, S subunit
VFCERVRAVREVEENGRRAASELDALFASLQHRAFRGEL